MTTTSHWKNVRTLAEVTAVLGVLLGLIFVGLEIRQNNELAQAAAYQAIGIATADHHMSMASDDLLSRLWTEAGDSRYLPEWSWTDWTKFARALYSQLRLTETVLIQVEQGLLPQDAMDRLGYGGAARWLQSWPALACLWPMIREEHGQALREHLEQVAPASRFDCGQLDIAINHQGIGGD